MDFLQSLNLIFCQSHTAFFFSQLMRHWTQTHSLLFSLLTLCLIAALVQFHHVLINEKTYFLILAGSAFYLILRRLPQPFDKMHFLLIPEIEFFYELKRNRITSLHGIHATSSKFTRPLPQVPHPTSGTLDSFKYFVSWQYSMPKIYFFVSGASSLWTSQ